MGERHPYESRTQLVRGEASPEEPGEGGMLLRAGRVAWASIGLVALLVLVGFVVAQLSLVVVPLVLALFPAALLAPAAGWLKRHRVPAAAASLVIILASLLALAGGVALLVPVVTAQLPRLTESFTEGLIEIESVLRDLPLNIGGLDELLDRVPDEIGGAGEFVGPLMRAASTAGELAAGLVLALVALFFYLKDGERIAAAMAGLLPARVRPHLEEVSGRVWATLAGYFRGQLLVALVDAVLIGLGLRLLGIPLAVPLGVLVFFGGLFPIVGAFVSGAVAVLVALAARGLVVALIALVLIVLVQQLESNLLAPVVLGRVLALHPLVIITSLTAGAVTLGVLGAFLAVPLTASAARALEYFRSQELSEQNLAKDHDSDDDHDHRE